MNGGDGISSQWLAPCGWRGESPVSASQAGQGRERVRGTLCATGGVLPLISRASDSDSESGMADDTKQKAAVRQAQTLEDPSKNAAQRHDHASGVRNFHPSQSEGGRHRRKLEQEAVPPPSVTWLNSYPLT
jgi:hypothetical protein